MELTAITRRIWIILALLVGCVGIGYFFTYQAYNSYMSTSLGLKQAQFENNQLRESISRMDQFLGEYESRKDDADIAELALPAKSLDVPNILAGLGDLASASGVVLSSFNISEPEDVEAGLNAIQTITINLVGSGTYASFEDFVLRLENHLRLIDIDKINVTTQGDNNNLQYQISLKTYYQK